MNNVYTLTLNHYVNVKRTRLFLVARISVEIVRHLELWGDRAARSAYRRHGRILEIFTGNWPSSDLRSSWSVGLRHQLCHQQSGAGK